jgi:polygalacturonase
MSNRKLYGDGLHDDTDAIQALLDSGICDVELPVPEKEYLISRTLIIHSNQTLRLPQTATIKLMPHSDCLMLTNRGEDDHDIAVIGGIWDFNNLKQRPNPLLALATYVNSRPDGLNVSDNPDCTVDTHYREDVVMRYTDEYRGVAMRFSHIKRFVVRDLTIKDPVTFCLQMAYVTHFTIENIQFDQNWGNPHAEHMDGIHIDGGCRFGLIRNIQGTCYDDMVALNADDFYDGPIEDIVIDGVFGRDSLRGVRLLSIDSPVQRISISNLYGTFYQNAIALTYFYPRFGTRGRMDQICIRNIFAEHAPRLPVYNRGGNDDFVYSLLWVDGDLDIGHLNIENLHRREKVAKIETLVIRENTNIDVLAMSHISQVNETGAPITLFRNEANIEKLFLNDIQTYGDKLLENNGTIGKLIADEDALNTIRPVSNSV